MFLIPLLLIFAIALYSIKMQLLTKLKVSAIAALGEYGNRNDLDIIEPYCKSSDVRLRTAAINASKKLNNNTQ